MKKKIDLGKLKVESFITNDIKENAEKLKGGVIITRYFPCDPPSVGIGNCLSHTPDCHVF